MGGNGTYSEAIGGIPEASRSFFDTDYRVEGRKVLVNKTNPSHKKVPENSNSESPIYLCGEVNKITGSLKISTIAVYEKHRLVKTIDLTFDANGDLIPFSQGKNSSHSHVWKQLSSGDVGRKSHDPRNVLPVDSAYESLVREVVKFNKSKKIWKN